MKMILHGQSFVVSICLNTRPWISYRIWEQAYNQSKLADSPIPDYQQTPQKKNKNHYKLKDFDLAFSFVRRIKLTIWKLNVRFLLGYYFVLISLLLRVFKCMYNASYNMFLLNSWFNLIRKCLFIIKTDLK